MHGRKTSENPTIRKDESHNTITYVPTSNQPMAEQLEIYPREDLTFAQIVLLWHSHITSVCRNYIYLNIYIYMFAFTGTDICITIINVRLQPTHTKRLVEDLRHLTKENDSRVKNVPLCTISSMYLIIHFMFILRYTSILQITYTKLKPVTM